MDAKDITEEVPELKGGALPVIWGLQLELLEEYRKIEQLPPWPLNLDLRNDQEMMKDFIARVTEELAESYEALENGDMDNAKEELADALHFLVEALIYTAPYDKVVFAYTPNTITGIIKDMLVGNYHNNIVEWFWETTYHLNIARNNLRNKKWKQTQVLAQKREFLKNMMKGLHSLINGFQLWGMSEADIFEIYYKKNRINWFRIKSKY